MWISSNNCRLKLLLSKAISAKYHTRASIYICKTEKYHNTKQIIHSEAECLIEIVHILFNTKVLPGV